ncbi:MAG: FAD-dependent oxidoreductase [Arachnia sp.]
MNGPASPDVDLQQDWDLVVLGAGTAGLLASRIAASLGARVLLIERDRPGGDCLWTGCVPSKALIAAARSAGAERRLVVGPGPLADEAIFGDVMRHVRNSVRAIEPDDSVESLERDGVTVLLGQARFADGTTVVVDDRRISFRQAVIATGARPVPLDVEGADKVEVLTSSTVWDLDVLPRRLLVIGGGCVGSEIGQAMARLGSHVSIVQRGPRLMPKESAEAEAVIRDAFTTDGIDVRTGRTVSRIVSSDGRAGAAHLDNGSVVEFDRILIALGRAPNTEALGLVNAGVAVDGRGRVIVDDHLRTSSPRIWAAGDVTPLPQFTHTAGVNGSIAGSNAVLGLQRRMNTGVIPRVTFTQPEVAAVGLQASDCAGTRNRVVTLHHTHLDRAIAEGATSGFTQVITDPRGRILGATIVGPRAGESLGEVTLAVANKLTASQVTDTMHAYPTFNDGFWNACVEITRTRLGSGWKKHGIRALLAVHRRRSRPSQGG